MTVAATIASPVAWIRRLVPASVLLPVLALAALAPSATVANAAPRSAATEHFSEFFEGSQSDLAFSSVTFTPDGSPGFYRACRQVVSGFFVDPAGGTGEEMNDDDAVRVDLAEGRSVSLYGVAARSFFVGSNGYVTFATEDKEYQPGLSEHFDLPRVSVLFADLNPRVEGQTPITWKQLPDRVVVTWLDILQRTGTPGLNNDFQVEFFFDGRIRLTWLEIHASGAVVGLSRGEGVPVDLVETDFSALAGCAACAHEVCASGAPLSDQCSACAAEVCSVDPFCCTDTWDGQCISEAACLCGEQCYCGNAQVNELCKEPDPANVLETCDDGGRVGGDGCSIDCKAETCGDGEVTVGEQCDDGNVAAGDGCDDDCTLEPGYCTLTFGFYDFTNPAGALQTLGLRALYPDSDALLVKDAPLPGCLPLVPMQGFEFIEGDEGFLKALDLTMDLGADVVHGPVDLVRCLFRLSGDKVVIGPGAFAPNLTSDSYAGGVDSTQPRVAVTNVTCGAPIACGDGDLEGTEQCDDGNAVADDGCEPDCTVAPFQHLTEVFDAGDNDLAFSSVTFFPDDSPDGYRACRRSGVLAFDVDPTDAETVAPDPGGSVAVELTGDREVALYGVSARVLHLGSDGSITLGRGGADVPASAASHFALPRVSGLLSDLDVASSAQARLSWKQLADRVAVTWQDIVAPEADPGLGNDFQVELFFDGRIRLTWLALNNANGVVGLSDGGGLPDDFVEKDFSASAECASCGHEACDSGAALTPQCSSCAALVCASDDFCCNSEWDGACVNLADELCDLECHCGDAATNPTYGEACDDGNLVGGDGCDARCLAEACGDASLTTGELEQCDDGNVVFGDGCSQTCEIEAASCDVTFAVSHASAPISPIEALAFDVDAVAAGGHFRAKGDGAACVAEDGGWTGSADFVGQTAVLRLDLVATGEPFYGSRDVWRCAFALDDPDSPPTAPEFSFEVAGDDSLSVGVARIECRGAALCGDGAVVAPEGCDDGNTLFEVGERCAADCRLIPCGKPTDSSGVDPQAKDALFILRAAVGQKTCVLPVCDVDSSGKVTSTDALRVLRKAVGQAVTLNCSE